MVETLLKKLQNKEAIICVVGLGRVGLPLASVFANTGFKVIGIDVNKTRVESVINSKSPFHDPALQESLAKAIKSGKMQVFTDLKNVRDYIDLIIVTVGTPNTSDNNVDYSQLYSSLDEICTQDLHEKFIILRSTMPPGTTMEIVIPYLEHRTGLECGKDFMLAVCPERILEGHAIREINELPEIIGGINEFSNKLAAELFHLINPKKEMLYTSISGAELAKLFANIYRYISFALANEFAIWAEKYGLDASELIKIANYNYPRSNIPVPGFAGGPCLSKDGIFLDNNTTFSSIVSTAWKLNESIPQHIVNTLKKTVGNLFNKKIGVLGLSFKANSDDLRNSPSVKLVEILKSSGANVLVHDPYVRTTLPLSDVLKSVEIVILATNHKEFKEIASEIVKSDCKVVYDVWSMYKDGDFPGLKYLRFGRG